MPSTAEVRHLREKCSCFCYTSLGHCRPIRPHILRTCRHIGRSTFMVPANGVAMSSICAQLPRAAIRARHPHAPRTAYARLSCPPRHFSTTRPTYEQFNQKESFRSRLNSALKGTKVKWEPIPIALGVGFLGAFQVYRIQRREKHTQSGGDDTEEVLDPQGRPKKRERIRPSGPWSAEKTPVGTP